MTREATLRAYTDSFESFALGSPVPLDIYLMTSITRACISSIVPILGNLLAMTPKMTLLFCGRYCKGSNRPLLGGRT